MRNHPSRQWQDLPAEVRDCLPSPLVDCDPVLPSGELVSAVIQQSGTMLPTLHDAFVTALQPKDVLGIHAEIIVGLHFHLPWRKNDGLSADLVPSAHHIGIQIAALGNVAYNLYAGFGP